jgi:hypothetical protein
MEIISHHKVGHLIAFKGLYEGRKYTLTSKERWSWEDQEHGLVCSPYNAPIDSSTRRSLKSEKGHNHCTSKEKYNKKGIKKLEIRKRTEQSHL